MVAYMHLAVQIAIGIAPAFTLSQDVNERSHVLDSYRGDAKCPLSRSLSVI